jgi:hypothetical protein
LHIDLLKPFPRVAYPFGKVNLIPGNAAWEIHMVNVTSNHSDTNTGNSHKNLTPGIL